MLVTNVRLFVLGLTLLSVSACSGTVQDRFGLQKRAPDEFQVVRRAPLVIPPDYALRAPGDGSDAAVVATPAEQAQELLTGEPAPELVQPSSAEMAVLEMSPVAALPGIRERILEESTELVQLDEDRFLFILDFQRRDLQGAPELVDPVEESQRLNDAGIPTRVVTQRVSSETFVTRPGLPVEEAES